MSLKIDLTHETFGKLFVLGKTQLKWNGQPLWACHCDCKNFRLFTTNFLTKRGATDCGCEHKNACRSSKITHGYKGSKVYSVADSAIRRCHDINKDNYPSYGGRGITVCDEWRNDRAEFCRWLESEGFRDGLQVDRIDNDKGYSPENCRLLPNSFNGINKKSSSLTGVCGVNFKSNCPNRPFLATVRLYGNLYTIGRFTNLSEAKHLREFVTVTVCEQVAELCKKEKETPVEKLKDAFIKILEDCLHEVRAVAGASI